MYKYSDLARKIIGVAMRVHRELGSGFQERIYHRAMEIALSEYFDMVAIEKKYNVLFESVLVGTFRLDLVVNDTIVVELKAICGEMPKLFYTQTISYLRASGLEVGLLINFGNDSIDVKRFANYREYDKNKSVQSN